MSGAPSAGAAGDGSGVSLGPGAEFDLVREMVARWGALARGIGSDCAVVDVPSGERLIVTTDTSVEGVHFRREWLSATEIGYRAATAALSDLGAAAATPIAMMVALTLPAVWRNEALSLADGFGEAAAAAGAYVAGGDISGGAQLSITVTAVGSAAHPLGRAGALPGDTVYATGAFGGPGGALDAWLRGARPADEYRHRFAHPVARLREARWLAEHGARAAIDVSDGVAADIRHLAAASGVTIALDADSLPRLPGVSVEQGLASGEEYELLVAAAPDLHIAEFTALFGVALTPIGQVSAGPPEVKSRVDLPRGHDHLTG